MKIITLSVTTDGSGDGNTTHTEHVQGYLYAVQLIDGSFADGVDVTLACLNTELTYNLFVKANFNTDQMAYPRTLQHLDTDGTNLTTHCEPIVFGKPKVTIAQGGDTKTGSVRLFVRDWD